MPQMTTSRSGILFIACREAIVEVPYQDGEWLSIGCGHNGPDVKPGDRWTPQEALAQLRDDIGSRYERDVNRLLRGTVNQSQFDALVSFHFNRGNRDFAWASVGSTGTIIDAVNGRLEVGDDAAGAALDENIAALWPTFDTNSKGQHLAGLRTRRLAELRVYQTGDYGPLATIPWWKGDPHTTHRFEYAVQPDDLA